jgi:formate hydrogenlyase subunit 3/multisubunit Na+/H+ antiporter MnhD subunit
MSKIWRFVFLRKRPEEDDSQAQQPAVDNRNPYGMYLSMGIFCLLILWLSFFPATVIDLSQRAAEQLFEREVYIEAVLKTGSYAQVD